MSSIGDRSAYAAVAISVVASAIASAFVRLIASFSFVVCIRRLERSSGPTLSGQPIAFSEHRACQTPTERNH
jgi:hypothetical protein